MVQFLPSLRAWEPDCSPTTHSRPQLCLTATAMCRLRIMKGNDALSVCVCWYLQPHSHFTSSQQRSHNEEQGEQNTSLAPPLHMYAVTGCDTVSYPFNKGKLTALSKLREGNFPELYSVVGEETAMLEDLLRRGQTFFAALYGQPKCTYSNAVRYTIYTKKKGKPPLVKSLPPTAKNLLLHMLRAHHQRYSRRQQTSRLPQQLSSLILFGRCLTAYHLR